MRKEDDESPSEALTEFARRIIRAGVGSDQLVAYMDELLSVKLIELHASCRQAAATIAKDCPGLGSCEVARCLFRIAHKLRGTDV